MMKLGVAHYVALARRHADGAQERLSRARRPASCCCWAAAIASTAAMAAGSRHSPRHWSAGGAVDGEPVELDERRAVWSRAASSRLSAICASTQLSELGAPALAITASVGPRAASNARSPSAASTLQLGDPLLQGRVARGRRRRAGPAAASMRSRSAGRTASEGTSPCGAQAARAEAARHRAIGRR